MAKIFVIESGPANGIDLPLSNALPEAHVETLFFLCSHIRLALREAVRDWAEYRLRSGTDESRRLPPGISPRSPSRSIIYAVPSSTSSGRCRYQVKGSTRRGPSRQEGLLHLTGQSSLDPASTNPNKIVAKLFLVGGLVGSMSR